MNSNFRLDQQPWIPVLRGSDPTEVSLRTLLTEAHDVSDLDWAEPLEAVAVLGTVLTLVTDIFEVHDLDRWANLWEQGLLPAEDVDRYFADHGSRFDLFDPQHPFAQAPGLQATSGETKPSALLVASIATGNNVPLFSTSTEADSAPLTAPSAARKLLACLAFDTAAIKTGAQGDPAVKGGKVSGNPTGPLGQCGVVTLVGRTLFETLMLNLPVTRPRSGDSPSWRTDAATPAWSERAPRGPLDTYTWASRRIRLFPEVVDGEVVVPKVLVCAGDRLQGMDPRDEFRTAWRRVEDKQRGSILRPRRLQPGRTGWRGLAPLLTRGDAGDQSAPRAGVLDQLARLQRADLVGDEMSVQVQLVGVSYGNQSAVVEDVMSDRTPLPLAALDERNHLDLLLWLEQMAQQADSVAHALNALGDNLRRAVGGDKVPWDKGQRLGEVFLSSVAADAHRVLAGLGREPDKLDQVKIPWQGVLRRRALALAEPQIEAIDPRGFLGAESEGLRQANAEAYFRAELNKALPDTASGVDPQHKER